jgi:hypothetical protein
MQNLSFRERLIADLRSAFVSYPKRWDVPFAPWLPLSVIVQELKQHFHREWRKLGGIGINSYRLALEVEDILAIEPTKRAWYGRRRSGYALADLKDRIEMTRFMKVVSSPQNEEKTAAIRAILTSTDEDEDFKAKIIAIAPEDAAL